MPGKRKSGSARLTASSSAPFAIRYANREMQELFGRTRPEADEEVAAARALSGQAGTLQKEGANFLTAIVAT